ncbi:Uncharacterized protein Rs2_09991 [Raphanus sativus]|nr:Uncharacterized protein Rs2_09991 [Raphanus sativus]
MKQLYTIKSSSGFPGTVLLAPREGRFVISGVPTKTFLVRLSPSIDPSFVGPVRHIRQRSKSGSIIGPFRIPLCHHSSHQFSILPDQSPYLPLPDECLSLGLSEVKRAEPLTESSDALSDSEPLKRVRRTPDKRVLRSSSQAQSQIVVATLVSMVVPVRGDHPES